MKAHRNNEKQSQGRKNYSNRAITSAETARYKRVARSLVRCLRVGHVYTVNISMNLWSWLIPNGLTNRSSSGNARFMLSLQPGRCIIAGVSGKWRATNKPTANVSSFFYILFHFLFSLFPFFFFEGRKSFAGLPCTRRTPLKSFLIVHRGTRGLQLRNSTRWRIIAWTTRA